MAEQATTETEKTETEATTTEMPEPKAAPDWRSSLPEDIRADKSLKDIKDVGALAKGFINAQKTIGAGRVTVPKDDAPTEEWDAFYAKIGRPENADGYVAPEGVKVDDAIIKQFWPEAHKLGLTKQQAAGLIRFQASLSEQLQASQAEADKKAFEEADAQLRKDWGEAFDERLELANQALSTFGGPDMAEYLKGKGLDNDPRIVKMLSEAGKMMAEDQIRGRGTGSLKQTTEEAMREIESLEADSAFMSAYHDRSEAGHKAAVAKMTRLYEIAFPGEIDLSTGRSVVAGS